MLTHSDEPLELGKQPSRSAGDTADAVALLKQTDGRDLLIQGSSTLYPPLLSARLIDQLIVMTFPVVARPRQEHFRRIRKGRKR